LRILLDKNVPIGLRRFLTEHQVSTFEETGWAPQLENGELLKAAESANFAILITADQNIPYQ
jgi:predicted nuclease of predicted toxin-antitoxin system